ncbi:glycine oxidase ThiO [Agromyces sp. SYSU K20354]|uniref:glycine oxidase ThiO n=1 Tax=Agromyces cavernae TaxID=2898659 RepID=UPI001E2ED38C|nr:glycine oxidase ThiO [Agromyces cavernae]MCD2443441.1 glycine oxidase ThiO [Agromyces cavernae]
MLSRVKILGAGIIGLACADELVRRGHRVTLVDPAPGSGASHAAAGMLSPAGELWHGESELFVFGARSAALWPDFAARLDVPLREEGTLLAALDHGDLQQVLRQAELLASHDVTAEQLARDELLALEPGLSDRVVGGARLPDRSVDPRVVVAALRRRLASRVEVVEAAGDLDGLDRRADHDVTIVATGALLPAPFDRLVRPVRGEIVRVRSSDPPRHTIRGWAHGEQVYAVPRTARAGVAEVVVGATSEEHNGPPVATVGGVSRLLDSARRLIPGLDRAEFAEAIARDRPGTPDNLPLVGATDLEGVILAAGHFRHGVLLAPLTAQLVADQVESGHVEPALDPRRFARSDLTSLERTTA